MKPKSYKKYSDSLRFAPISGYSRKERFLIRVIDYGLHIFIRLLGKTIRFDTAEKSSGRTAWKFAEQFTADKPRCIAVFWHDRILLTTYFWRFSNYAAMVSESFDGEYIARTAQRLGHGIARGSSTRGGTKALRLMSGLLKKEKFSLALTVDGPKGPRYEVKSGAVQLAKINEVPIIPVLIEPEKFWTLSSWDKLQIPKPFTRAKVFASDPIFVPRDTDKKDIENIRSEVQRKLDELVLRGEQWRKSKH